MAKFGFATHLCWVLIFILLAGPPLLQAGQGVSDPVSVAVSVEMKLQQGIEAYQGLDYEAGVRILEELLSEALLTASQRREAFLYLGLCEACLGNVEGAGEAFVRLLEMEPEYRLDPNLFSPKILAVFDQAREEYQRELRHKDSLPPILEYETVLQPVPHRREVPIRVRVMDDQSIRSVQLFFRKGGETAYAFVQMVAQEGDLYEAHIPAGSVEREGVQYYILAMDRAGNAALKGNASFPLVLVVERGPEAKRWYEKWWVWTIVAAAAGAGAALGVSLADGGGDDGGGTASLRIDLE